MTDDSYRKPTWEELAKQRWGPSLRHNLPSIVVDAPPCRLPELQTSLSELSDPGKPAKFPSPASGPNP